MEAVKLRDRVDPHRVIEVLEEALERAKAGEFESIILLAFQDDTSFIVKYSGTVDLIRQLGVLEVAKSHTLSRIRGQDG